MAADPKAALIHSSVSVVLADPAPTRLNAGAPGRGCFLCKKSLQQFYSHKEVHAHLVPASIVPVNPVRRHCLPGPSDGI